MKFYHGAVAVIFYIICDIIMSFHRLPLEKEKCAQHIITTQYTYVSLVYEDILLPIFLTRSFTHLHCLHKV